MQERSQKEIPLEFNRNRVTLRSRRRAKVKRSPATFLKPAVSIVPRAQTFVKARPRKSKAAHGRKDTAQRTTGSTRARRPSLHCSRTLDSST